MIAPKTHTNPRQGCCKFDIQIYRNPIDPVPNQSVLRSAETDNFWSQWGDVNTVYTRGFGIGNHSFPRFFDPNNTLIPVVPNPNPPAITTGQGAGAAAIIRPQYVRSGRPINMPADVLNQWLNDTKTDFVFVCHSQGCNIAMQVLQQGCNKGN